MTNNTDDRTSRKITEIALESLNIESLETRNRGDLDFHELAVWQIKEALEAAYQAGAAAARGE